VFHSVNFPALGSTALVAVTARDAIGTAEAAVRDTIEAFDLACSRFRSDSELSAVNAADGRPVEVSELMMRALSASLRAARLTDGDVDPTIGRALIALGYDRDFAEVTGGERRPVTVATVAGWRCVELDPDARMVRVPRGVKLDLGATAKALAADQAAAAAREAAGCGVLVSLGGDLAVAGEAPSPQGWRIRVTDDHRSGIDAPGQWITLADGGLATSSTTARSWQTIAGEIAHHLIDPGTGRAAASRWRTVSVAAASCLDANIASTAAIIRSEAALPWLGALKLPSRLVDVDGRARHLAGWPAEGDDLG
jgi:FAD:protein FMN transferase